MLSINVTARSADGFLLAVRRSGAVETSQNLWTPGPNETMNLPDLRPGSDDDFYSLAERCLREEVGLEPNLDDGDIEVSWMGHNVSAALVHIVAHVAATRTRSEIVRKISECHGAFEIDRIDWLPDDLRSLRGIVVEHASTDPERRWIESGPLAAQQCWRFRPALL